eukprot:gene15962-17568_t
MDWIKGNKYLSDLNQVLEIKILVPVLITISLIIVTVLVIVKKLRNKDEKSTPVKTVQKPRFRKRDKVMFYGRRIIRKVKEFKNEIMLDIDETKLRKRRSASSYRKRILFPPFAERFLHHPKTELMRLHKDIPPSVLEADTTELPGLEPRLPSEVMYMLRSVRVFGHFEKPLFFELCKHLESKTLTAGTLLIKPGQMEDCIYIVQSGQLDLHLVDKTGNELFLKKVNAGDNIHSVLNILDAIRGTADFRFSLIARATMKSEVLKLPSKAFHDVFHDNSESLVRIVQIIMVRLQQVTFQALNRFLGLKSELISTSSSYKLSEELKSLSIYSLNENKAPPHGEAVQQQQDGSTTTATTEIDSASPSKENRNENNKPIRRTVSFTNAVSILGENGKKTELAESSPIKIKRTRSSERFRTSEADHADSGKRRQSYGSGSVKSLSIDTGVSPSDFEIACGRAGIDITGSSSGMFDVGTPDNSPPSDSDMKFQFPKYAPIATPNSAKKCDAIDSNEEDLMRNAAAKDLAHIFGLDDPSILDDAIALACVPSGSALVRQGDQNCSLYFLVRGSLTIMQKTDNGVEEKLYSTVPGEFVSSIALLTGEPSFFTIVAEQRSFVVIISKLDFYNLMMHHPRVVIPVAFEIIKRLSSFVRNIDFALDWVMIDGGKSLYKQGDQADSIFIVLNGRLRAVHTSEDGKKELAEEYGRGEVVGLVEVLTHSSRVCDVLAIRDTELAKIPDGLLNTIKLQYPQVVTRLIHLLGDRMLGNFKKSASKIGDSQLERMSSNLGTIAVIPASPNVPLSNFTFELSLALKEIGSTLLLTSDLIKKRLGGAVLDSLHEYYLSNWLGQQEETQNIIVYQSDFQMTEWTKRCIRRADAILIVCLGDADSRTVGMLESELERMTSVKAQKDLILLYREDKFEHPVSTVEWLNARGWISAHHHVRCPKKIFSRRLLAERYADDISYELPLRTSDFARLARRLTGTSVGLVLGGGGARGFAHVGIIKALEEAGIPIDMVGGTSMGSFIGALYAEDACSMKLVQRSRSTSVAMSSIFKKLLDLTYPHTSLFSGNRFNKEISDVIGERMIEDLLLPYFCISTDITDSKMKIHQTGSLWRYVRASMSLAGYLPPLCDPVGGNLLLDGGYVNNLPADVMKSLGARTIIAVDVGSLYEPHMTNYGDKLSGWWVLWNKWNPFGKNLKIPTMDEIQGRLAYVSCVQQLEEVRNSSYCHYVRPPVDEYKTLQFGSFEEIMNVGYKYGKKVFESLIEGNALPDTLSYQDRRASKSDAAPVSPSFHDLAELVSRISPPISRKPTEWTKARNSDSSSMLFETELDEYYDDTDVHLARRARSGSLSDQDLFQDSHSGVEEAGYESEDPAKLVHMRKKMHILLRTNSNAV